MFVVNVEFHRKRKAETGRERQRQEDKGRGRYRQEDKGRGRQRQAKAAKVVGNVPSLYIPGRSR